MDYEDCFANFDQKESDEIVCDPPVSSAQLLENLTKSHSAEALQTLVEQPFYFQCRVLENSDKVSIHVCELGRHNIRVYGYYCAEAKELEVNPSLDFKSIVLRGYRDEQTDMFVVKPHEFRDKNILFEGTMPDVVPFEVQPRQNDSEKIPTQVDLNSQDCSCPTLDVMAVTELISFVEQNCPGLISSSPTANNSQPSLPLQFQSPVKSTISMNLESPTTMVFGHKPLLCEPLTPENRRAPSVIPVMNASTVQSDMTFPHFSQKKEVVSLFQHNRSPTPPFNWGPVSLSQATNQIVQPQPASQQARRSLQFPSAAQTSRQALPLASSAANFASAALPANTLHQASLPMNYASSMAANVSQHQISRVRVEVVRQQAATSHGHKPSVNSNLSGYAKMFQSVHKPETAQPLPRSEPMKSAKQAVESRGAAVVAKNPVVSPVHNSVDDMYTEVNGIPCFYFVRGDGTRQLMVTREYFIKPTNRFEGFKNGWIFLRDSNDSAAYYRSVINVDPAKVKIPGYSNYEIVEFDDEEAYYRVSPDVIFRKVCDVKQDVFPFFYKNSTQYRNLKDEEKAKYVACKDGPKPPFEYAVYSNLYYLKEIPSNEFLYLERGYPTISNYYKQSETPGCLITYFCMEYHKKIVQINWSLEMLFAKELNKEMEEAKKQLPPIPKKVSNGADSLRSAENDGKHNRNSKKPSKSKGSDAVKPGRNVKKPGKKVDYSTDSDYSVHLSDLDDQLDEEESNQKEKKTSSKKREKNKKSGDTTDLPGDFYELCARIDKGENVFPERKSSNPGSKRKRVWK